MGASDNNNNKIYSKELRPRSNEWVSRARPQNKIKKTAGDTGAGRAGAAFSLFGARLFLRAYCFGLAACASSFMLGDGLL